MSSGPAIIFLIFMFLFVIAALVLWIMAIIDIVKHDFNGDNKMIWLLIVILLGLLGVILYYAIGRKERILESDSDSDIIV